MYNKMYDIKIPHDAKKTINLVVAQFCCRLKTANGIPYQPHPQYPSFPLERP